MSCAQVQALVPLASFDVLDEDERELLEAHSARCAPCRDRRAALDAALAPLGEPLPDLEPVPATWDAVAARLGGAARAPAPDEHEHEPEHERRARLAIALACVFCHGALPRDEAVYCASCLAPQHDDCFAAHGACAAPGCGERLTVRPLLEGDGVDDARPARRRAAWLLTTGLSAVLGSAAALTAWQGRDREPAAPLAVPAPLPGEAGAPDVLDRTACVECGRPVDPSLPPLRLGGPEAEPAFCDATHRRAYLLRRALVTRADPLEARVLGVEGTTRARLGVGLRAGAGPGDRFAVWRAGILVARVELDRVSDDEASGSLDLVSHGDAPRVGDLAVRVVDAGVWESVAARQEARQQLELVAARARQARVLYVEGFPRREYQHLRRVLTRWTRAQVYLASADADFVQDASEGLAPLRMAPTALDGYEVVVLGADVWRTAAGLSLGTFVRQGGGLVLLPGPSGPRDLPDHVRDLAPVARSSFGGGARPDGEVSLYRFGPALQGARQLFGGAALPSLQLEQRPRVRLGAEVQLSDARGQELVVTWELDRGRVVYVGSDELWRWRKSGGEEAHAALWLELVAWAAGRERR